MLVERTVLREPGRDRMDPHCLLLDWIVRASNQIDAVLREAPACRIVHVYVRTDV